MFTRTRRFLPVTVILLSFFVVSLQAQDREAPRNAGRFLAFPAAQRGIAQRPLLQKQFMIGFNWGGLPEDSMTYKALHIKAVHGGFWPDTSVTSGSYRALHDFFPWGTALIHADNVLSKGHIVPYSESPSMQYDPVVSNLGTAYGFKERLGDTTGAVWGFQQRDTEVGKTIEESLTNSFLENYGRMFLRDSTFKRVNIQDGLSSTTPRLVLSQMSPNKLQFMNDIDALRTKYDVLMNEPSLRVRNNPSQQFLYNKTDMYIRDSRLPYFSLPFSRLRNGVLDTMQAPSWLDTTLRGGGITIIHMKGDSTEWWLAASLRRLQNPAQDNADPNAIVMSLKVPMVIRYDTLHYDGNANLLENQTGIGTTLYNVYARFDSAAVAGDTLFHSFYGCMDNALGAVDDTVFYIRAGMLPPFDRFVDNQFRPDITLSAHFWLPRFASNNRYKTMNPYESGGTGIPQTGNLVGFPRTVVTPVVVSMDMQVRYHGNVDVGLDWLRFESRLARMILRGQKDSLIQHAMDYWYNYMNQVAPNRGQYIYAHYMYDESNGFFWRTQRHMSRLLEDIGTTETTSFHRGQYRHQTGDRQHWISWIGLEGDVSAPFIRFGAGSHYNDDAQASYATRRDRAMGIFSGYKGVRYPTFFGTLVTDPRDFETAIEQNIWNASDSLYRAVLKKSHSVQSRIESYMEERIINNEEMLYGPLPVWYNSWLISEWKLFDNPYSADRAQRPKTPYWLFTRPQTGEEIRVFHSLAFALGGKGLMPYKAASSVEWDNGVGQYGLLCYPSVTGTTGRFTPAGQTTGTNGGDFLDSLHTIWRYMNADSIAWAMGIPKNRLYVGTTSLYNETVRQHTFADNNSAELMRLQLQAVYSKGYRLVTNSKSDSVNIGRYIDTSGFGSQFHVRRIHNADGTTWTGGDEPFRDSTYFLVTLLKDSAKSLDETMYVGIVNRRTNPTVVYTGSGGTNLDNNEKFFSTDEFNALLTTGSLNNYAYPQYAQTGSRSITLPLRLGALLTDSVFSLVRVSEVGGTLDTLMGENALSATTGLLSLSFRFKPGEGRLFRISVLHPGTIPEGLLGYSNQRKMVAVTYSSDTTKVRYHLAYHRKVDDKDNRSEVFYRRSKPTARNSDEANIVWEPEVPVSTAIYLPADPLWKDMKYKPNCAYPSLVVRPDNGDKEMVYIVYACTHPDGRANEMYIAERVIAANASLSDPLLTAGHIIDSVRGRSLDNWGTPVISAIAGGNIYAYADSVAGIITAYKPLNSGVITARKPVRWTLASDSVQHPSLATYIRYKIGEKSTALVWQEDEQIYYASPYVDQTGALQLQKLPVDYNGAYDGGVSWLPPNNDTTILALCDVNCTRNNRMPVVYRGIEPTNGAATNILLGLDRVAWEGRSFGNSNTYQIYSRWIDLSFDTTQTNWPCEYMLRSGLNRFFSPRYSFHQADIAQGVLRGSREWWEGEGTVNGSDSAFVLSCVSWDWMGSYPPLTNTNVWHLPFSYVCSRVGENIYPTSYQRSYVIAQNGLNPHLAARPILQEGSWWQNRRVFEYGTQPHIAPSAQYFYRISMTRNDHAITKVLTYSKACNSYGMFEPMYKDVPLVMRPHGNGHGGVDTIASDPFPMAGAIEVSFYVTGRDTSLAKAELVEVHSGVRHTIPLVPATDTTAKLVAQTFTNGTGSLYRLEFIKQRPQAEYTANLLAGQIPLANSSGAIIGYAKSAGEERTETPGQIVNLAVAGTADAPGLHAYVYPNPAHEEISISVYRTYAENMAAMSEEQDNLLLVRVVSMLGTEIARFETRTGASLQLPVKHLPKGVYFVRVEQAGNPQESGVASFIVE